MRLTSDIITQARAFYNPLKQRELDIRGLKIPVMENLGAAENQFDVIDLSDNSIACIENIPKFPRLHTLLLNNNLVSQVTKDWDPTFRTAASYSYPCVAAGGGFLNAN